MTTTSPLATYQNGNVRVTIHEDGTKVREYDGEPMPEFPESMDLKITDWCDQGCPWCHESSTVNGKHAELHTIMEAVDGLPAGVEIAVGGGDPLAHPWIALILNQFKHRGLIANVTVNGARLRDYAPMIWAFRAGGTIHGLGVSFREDMDLSAVADPNTIVHIIAGQHDPKAVLQAGYPKTKILILGYKRYGRGEHTYSPKVDACLASWRYWIGTIIRMGGTVCFDNLALEQLRIKDQIPAELWERCYMGGDGQFTMYVDAVRDQFAVSSTSERMPRNGMNAREMFAKVRSL